MASDGQPSDNNSMKPRLNATRRQRDRLLVGTLAGACGFLFVVVALQGFYILKVVSDVDHNTDSVRKFVCVQNSAFHSALERETRLVVAGPPEQREAHKQSAKQLRQYLAIIDPIVDCSGFKLPIFPSD